MRPKGFAGSSPASSAMKTDGTTTIDEIDQIGARLEELEKGMNFLPAMRLSNARQELFKALYMLKNQRDRPHPAQTDQGSAQD